MIGREKAGGVVAGDFRGQAVGFSHVSRGADHLRAGRQKNRLGHTHVALMTQKLDVAAVGVVGVLVDVDNGVGHWGCDYNSNR